MSVEKFNPKVRGESIPYLQANRHVVQSITNLEALGVWIYLLSLPEDWKVIKEHVQKHFSIGVDKLKKIFSYLNRVGLIEYERTRNNDGTLNTVSIIVLNGSRFNDGKADLSTEITTGVKTTPLDNHTCGKQQLHIKQNTNEIKSKKSSSISENKKMQKAVNNPPSKPPKDQSKYVERNTMTDEAKTATRGSKKAEEDAMMKLPVGIRPRRYRNVITPTALVEGGMS